MISTFQLGALGNLIGWDGIIVLGVQIAFVVGFVLLVRFLIRRGATDQSGGALETRLHKLDSLRHRGAISEAEYQDQRRRILSRV